MSTQLSIASGGLRKNIDDNSDVGPPRASSKWWHTVAAGVNFVVAVVAFSMNTAASYKYDAPIVDVYANFADSTNSVTTFGQSSVPVHWIAPLPPAILFLYHFAVRWSWDAEDGYPVQLMNGRQYSVMVLMPVWALTTLVVVPLSGVADKSVVIGTAVTGGVFAVMVGLCEMVLWCDLQKIYSARSTLMVLALPAVAILTPIYITLVQIGQAQLPNFVMVMAAFFSFVLFIQLLPAWSMISGRVEGAGVAVTGALAFRADMWKTHVTTWGVSAVILTAVVGMYMDRN